MVHHELVKGDDQTVVRFEGELDWGARLSLEPVLERAVDEVTAGALVVDLRDVSFVDSSGVSLLIETADRARSAGVPLRILRPSPQVFRVFEVLGLVDVLPFAEPVGA